MSIVKLENIAVRFGMKTVFDRFNHVVDVGEFLCIMGESGSGKSTLLNVIGLLEKPTSGRVSLFGISGVSPGGATANKLRREKIGFLFQNYGLIDNEDIDYNLDIVRNKTCSRVDFSQRKQKMLFDLGLSSIKTNTKVYKLSGGEQQRIALARLVLKNSELILCDEPTGSLDMKNAEVVLDMLLRLNSEGKTIVIVTHDPEIARKATRVITLNNEPLDSV